MSFIQNTKYQTPDTELRWYHDKRRPLRTAFYFLNKYMVNSIDELKKWQDKQYLIKGGNLVSPMNKKPKFPKTVKYFLLVLCVIMLGFFILMMTGFVQIGIFGL